MKLTIYFLILWLSLLCFAGTTSTWKKQKEGTELELRKEEPVTQDTPLSNQKDESMKLMELATVRNEWGRRKNINKPKKKGFFARIKKKIFGKTSRRGTKNTRKKIMEAINYSNRWSWKIKRSVSVLERSRTMKSRNLVRKMKRINTKNKKYRNKWVKARTIKNRKRRINKVMNIKAKITKLEWKYNKWLMKTRKSQRKAIKKIIKKSNKKRRNRNKRLNRRRNRLYKKGLITAKGRNKYRNRRNRLRNSRNRVNNRRRNRRRNKRRNRLRNRRNRVNNRRRNRRRNKRRNRLRNRRTSRLNRVKNRLKRHLRKGFSRLNNMSNRILQTSMSFSPANTITNTNTNKNTSIKKIKFPYSETVSKLSSRGRSLIQPKHLESFSKCINLLRSNESDNYNNVYQYYKSLRNNYMLSKANEVTWIKKIFSGITETAATWLDPAFTSCYDIAFIGYKIPPRYSEPSVGGNLIPKQTPFIDGIYTSHRNMLNSGSFSSWNGNA